MIVNLLDGFYVDVDGMNFTLAKTVKGVSKKTKEETEYDKIYGYYGNMAGAVKRCAMEIVSENNSDEPIGIGEYVKQLSEVTTRLENMCL